jgi:hypothetical protein
MTDDQKDAWSGVLFGLMFLAILDVHFVSPAPVPSQGHS